MLIILGCILNYITVILYGFDYSRVSAEKVTSLCRVSNPVAAKSDRVQPAQEKFENAALFPRLGIPSTLIRHENGTFQKPSSNRRNLKTPGFRFRVDGKHFKTGTF